MGKSAENKVTIVSSCIYPKHVTMWSQLAETVGVSKAEILRRMIEDAYDQVIKKNPAPIGTG